MSETSPELTEDSREALGAVSKVWWLSLVSGILWFFIAIVILHWTVHR